MKPQFLLPMLATLCLTGAANSQSTDQPRRDPDPGRAPEARRESPDAPRSRPGALRPEARRDEPRRPDPRARTEDRKPDLRHSPGGDRPSASSHRPMSRPVPPELQELRDQVRRLSYEVQRLREMVVASQGSRARSENRPSPGFQPQFHRGSSGAGQSQAHPPMPPRDAPTRGNPQSGGKQPPQGDAGHPMKGRPHPPGDSPRPHGDDDREPQGNPPPR